MIYQTLLLCLLYIDFVKSGIFDDLENSELHAVRLRLEEEKATRLLLENDVSVLMLKVAQIERQLHGHSVVSASNKGCSPKSSHSVSFHASVSANSNLHLTSGQMIIFDDVITNHGNGYSPDSGTFRAPMDGTYFFSMNILTPPSKNIHASIFVKGIAKVNFYAGTPDAWSNPGSQSLVTDLEEGDEVFIKVTADGYLHGFGYDTFNGHLIN